MSLLNSLKGAVGRTYDYLTPGTGSSRLTDSAGWGDAPKSTAKTSTPSYTPSSTYSVDTSGIDKQIAASNAQIAALQSQLAAQPKLPTYNVGAAWSKAQQQAESIVNPVYLDKLNQYLEGSALKRQQQQSTTALNKENIGIALNQGVEDIGTSRQRTNEDTASSIADTNATEGEYQNQAGTQFDRARTALLEGFGDFGGSGLVKQQETNAITDRNTEENAQSRQFEKERKSAQVLQSRTLTDLDTKETRTKTDADQKNKQEDMDLKNFIDNAGLEEKQYRTQNELDRQSAIAGQVTNQYDIGLRDFINGLVSSGARPQDIALAQQVYG